MKPVLMIQRELEPMTPENPIYRDIPENSWTDIPLPNAVSDILGFITSLDDPVGTRYRIIREESSYAIVRQPEVPKKAQWI